MTKIIDGTDECKLPAWVCRMDEAQKSAENIGLFTDEQIEITRLIAEQAEAVYTFKGIYVNFRKNKSVIKLDRVYGEPTLSATIALKEFAKGFGFEKVWIKSSHSIKFEAIRIEKEEA